MQQLVRNVAAVVEKLKNLFSGKSEPVEPTVVGTSPVPQLIPQHNKAKKVAAEMIDQSVSLSEEKSPQLTQADIAKALWSKTLIGDKAAAMELLAFKKKAKKGWTVWGLPSTAGDTLKALLDP